MICGKYRKSRNPKISYIFEKTFTLSIICSKCQNEDEKIFKEKGIKWDIKKFCCNLKIYNCF